MSTNKPPQYIVVTVKSWNIELFEQRSVNFPGEWHLVNHKDQLTPEFVADIDPAYIFFPHWNWIVPKEITENYTCVCFHMTDLPYGRGGSPLQNLIVRGHKSTKLSALEMTEELDAGPIFKKVDLDLSGRAQDIYQDAAVKCYDLMEYIVVNKPSAQAQTGEITEFERRKPEQSLIDPSLSSEQLYDFIRMLDAEGYPHAYSLVGPYKLKFTQAKLEQGQVSATVTFTSQEKNHD